MSTIHSRRRSALRIALVAVPALVFLLGSLGATFGHGSAIIGLVRLLPGGDITGHILITGALAASCVALFMPTDPSKQRARFLMIIGILMALTAIDEGAQLFLRRRTASLSDLGANMLGIVMGASLALLLLRRFTRESDPTPDPRTCKS